MLVGPADLFDMLPIFLGIAEIEEILVSAVRAFHAPGVFDGAPVLFSSGGNLGKVTENSVGIGAIVAVKFLRKIQIR